MCTCARFSNICHLTRAKELWIDCFEEAQRLSSQQLQCSSEFAKTFSFDTVLARLIRHLPSCFGGLAGCLVGPFVATGLALPSWAACLGTARPVQAACAPHTEDSEDLSARFERDRAAAAKATLFEIFQKRKDFYDDGRGSELPPEERVPTPAEIAHQLMQSGDYGNGPPYPIEGVPPPPWRRQGLEGTDNVTVQTDHSVTWSNGVIRCFDGKGIERPCGPLYREDVNAEKDADENLLSGLRYAGLLTSGPTACFLQAAAALLSHRQALSESNLVALKQSREETWAAKAEFDEYKVQQQIHRQVLGH
eukprot:s278_g9.t1